MKCDDFQHDLLASTVTGCPTCRASSESEYTLATALAQLESCHFECEAGKLENNTAFVWLKGLVK
jgi:hypothetical protein